MAGLYDNSKFKLLRNFQPVFQGDYTVLHSYQQCMSFPISPHLCQNLLLSFFLIIDILVDMMWYLTVVLICILLMTNGFEHLCMCLLAICISFLEKCLFKSSANFLDWVVCFFDIKLHELLLYFGD